MIDVKPGPTPDTTEIHGQIFADRFFEEFCKAIPVGQWFKIVSRDNGIITMRCKSAGKETK